MEMLHRLLQLLLQLEEKSAETAGILPLRVQEGSAGNGQQGGLIMAERGRICWASSPRSVSRLSDRLLAVSGISRGQIEKVFQFCRRTEKPLGEHMVSVGILTREQLREALLSHTTAVLLSLGTLMGKEEAAPHRFQENRERSYNPMFTFSALELVLAMIRDEPELSVALGPPPDTFQRWESQVQHAICFHETSWEDVPAIPVCCNDAHDLSLGEAIQLFRHSRNLVEPPALVAAGVHPFSTVVREEKQGWLTSYIPPHFCLYRIDRPGELGSILSAILKETHEGRDEEDTVA